jgi:hypothetical protein
LHQSRLDVILIEGTMYTMTGIKAPFDQIAIT